MRRRPDQYKDTFKDNTFSSSSWSAKTMVSADNIKQLISSFNLVGRKIKRMKIIGLSYNLRREWLEEYAYNYYEKSENNTYEKYFGGYKFFTYRIVRKYADKIKYLTKGFDFIFFVIDIYLKSPFFNSTQKKLLIFFHEIYSFIIEKKYLNLFIFRLYL